MLAGPGKEERLLRQGHHAEYSNTQASQHSTLYPSVRSQGTFEGHSEVATVVKKISCTTALNKVR